MWYSFGVQRKARIKGVNLLNSPLSFCGKLNAWTPTIRISQTHRTRRPQSLVAIRFRLLRCRCLRFLPTRSKNAMSMFHYDECAKPSYHGMITTTTAQQAFNSQYVNIPSQANVPSPTSIGSMAQDLPERIAHINQRLARVSQGLRSMPVDSAKSSAPSTGDLFSVLSTVHGMIGYAESIIAEIENSLGINN